ncbi:MAG: ABC transporter ATP-binding protein [bacterium]
MIECLDLTKCFDKIVAVDHLFLEVPDGQLFGFLGPNGAGKTTTIKLLTGLLQPTEGIARIDGLDVVKQPIAAKTITGYVPDNAFLYEKLTGREMLDLTGDLWRITTKRRQSKIDDLLQLFDLTDKRDELIQNYSRGMRQKLSLACALLHEPKVLLLDEPTVGLDPKSSRLLKQVLRELANRGTTVFVSTHILEIAERLCDRVAIINQGKIIAQGTLEELRAGSNTLSLEEIFLTLTGDAENADLIKLLD